MSVAANRSCAAAKNKILASAEVIGLDRADISPDIACNARDPCLYHLFAPPAGRQDADRAAALRIPAAEERQRGGLRPQPEGAVAARISAARHRNR
ncbi:MAG: hypothetical protein E6G93_06685 [Alphaproteobacteria bacterium]|nr:MAG: hypothetical protein E6G93_06685 [Alphaproteobacteria bacterium]TMK49834.1 MAG: hypothetical protein E6G70_07895 [Alphaproteobacteria bacterium]